MSCPEVGGIHEPYLGVEKELVLDEISTSEKGRGAVWTCVEDNVVG